MHQAACYNQKNSKIYQINWVNSQKAVLW